MRVLILLIFQILWIALPSPVVGQAEEGRTRFLEWAYSDAGRLLASVSRQSPAYLAGTVAFLIPATIIDKDINPQVQSVSKGSFQSFLDATNELGGPGVKYPVTGIFALSLLTNDRKFQDAAFTSLQALAFSSALTYLIKISFGRVRPSDSEDPIALRPFSGNMSFPSGHTSAAFAVVTPWVLYYRRPEVYGLFALAAGTAMARMDRNKHWATDVLTGGVIGYLAGRWLYNRHTRHRQRLTFIPSSGPDGGSLSALVRF